METAIELDGQYRALREEAGFLARRRGVVLVKGPDGAEFLQGQLTNDVEALAANEGCYAALLDRKGHMQADMRVLRLSNGETWLDTETDAIEPVVRHLRMYSVGREVEIEDATGAWAVTSLIGPGAGEAADTAPLPAEHAQRFLERQGVEVLAVATDLGFDLITRAEQESELRALLEESAAVEVSEDAAEILRVESGRPRFGHEMSNATIPQEAGIDARAVSFTKGCYIGQETVARLHYKGKPNRHLRGLRLEAPVSSDEVIAYEAREVGRIGTAVTSPAHGPIALAVIRREAEPGTQVEVGEEGVRAQVVELPF
ncbi:MAG TPA: glycine cleavage T C-terminal barrel domain-containing protein [Solirubrobacterales bacterium]|nr:glycine cleavage T C-terminal barrel domain-containing protein [Solirubrobacterales bacterium]